MKDEARVRANKLTDQIKDYKGRLEAMTEDNLRLGVRGYSINTVISDINKNIIVTVINAEFTATLKKLEAELEAL